MVYSSNTMPLTINITASETIWISIAFCSIQNNWWIFYDFSIFYAFYVNWNPAGESIQPHQWTNQYWLIRYLTVDIYNNLAKYIYSFIISILKSMKLWLFHCIHSCFFFHSAQSNWNNENYCFWNEKYFICLASSYQKNKRVYS